MKSLLFAASLIAMLGFIPTNAATPSAYPLTTCVVSGEKLGEMGDPVVLNYNGTEVRFCCSSCVKKFKADPDKYLAKLKAAAPAK